MLFLAATLTCSRRLHWRPLQHSLFASATAVIPLLTIATIGKHPILRSDGVLQSTLHASRFGQCFARPLYQCLLMKCFPMTNSRSSILIEFNIPRSGKTDDKCFQVLLRKLMNTLHWNKVSFSMSDGGQVLDVSGEGSSQHCPKKETGFLTVSCRPRGAHICSHNYRSLDTTS